MATAVDCRLSKPVNKQDGGVSRKPDDWRRLGQIVRDWRDETGLTQQQIQAAGGPSTAKLRQIERGEGADTEDRTKRRLEAALGWRAGSFDTVLQGGDPVPAASVPSSQAQGSIVDDGFEVELVVVRIPRGATQEAKGQMLQLAARVAQQAVDQIHAVTRLSENTE